jgi:TP53 regulating kinase-like protein
MQIIKQGAESILYLDNFENQEVLVKERIPKRYRIKEIDDRLRKERTKKEVRLLTEARKFGIETPAILAVEENKIVMQFIDGKTVKEFFYSAKENEIKAISQEIGRIVGLLHSNGIIHGDLTTSNMILKNGKVFFIDFGLGEFSKKIENQGVDLNLLEEALKATHFRIYSLIWQNLLEAYKKEYKAANEVLLKVNEIEKRARYAER